MILGLLLALASAVATNLAFLFKHRGAVLAAPILVRHPLRSAVGDPSRDAPWMRGHGQEIGGVGHRDERVGDALRGQHRVSLRVPVQAA